MKHMTIWQRLNIALAVLVLLLMAGGGLALWIEYARAAADRESEKLDTSNDRIWHELAVMSDAVRGLMLLEPKSELEKLERNNEKNRRHAAEVALTKHLDEVEAESKDKPEVQRAIKAIRDFARSSL